MIRDFKYILKRIIIGVGIALTLSFLKGNLLIGVNAQEISSTNWGAQVFNIGPGASGVDFNISGSPWANWRYGYLYFDFGINKSGGSSTDMIIIPRSVVARSSSTEYICSFGSVSSSNSTYNGAGYSVKCPMDLGAPGLTSIAINFLPIGSGNSTYTVIVAGQGTFESANSESVSSDISNMNNTLQQQILNDNQNTQNIVNSQNNTTNAVNNNTNAINNVNDTLNNDNVDSNTGNDFFNNFNGNTHGLSGIITSPLRLINSLSDSTCTPLSFPLPFVNNNVVLPCMSSIYSKHFPTFLNLYRLITTGIIAYYICINLFSTIKNLQNPDNDKIEVLEL